MSILHKKDDQGIIRTYNSGRVSLHEFYQSVVALGRLTENSDEVWQLVIMEDDVVFEKDELRTMRIVHLAKETIQFKKRGAIAFVAPTRESMMTCLRMSKMLRGESVPVTTFEHKSDAVAWLRAHRRDARKHRTSQHVAGL